MGGDYRGRREHGRCRPAAHPREAAQGPARGGPNADPAPVFPGRDPDRHRPQPGRHPGADFPRRGPHPQAPAGADAVAGRDSDHAPAHLPASLAAAKPSFMWVGRRKALPLKGHGMSRAAGEGTREGSSPSCPRHHTPLTCRCETSSNDEGVLRLAGAGWSPTLFSEQPDSEQLQLFF